MWFQTVTGKKVYYNAPRKEEISIVDILHSLCRLPRFLGHQPKIISIGQHSLHVFGLVAVRTCWRSINEPFNASEPPPIDPRLALGALLHDAPEAYTGDIPAPLKAYLKGYPTNTEGPTALEHVEATLWAVVCEKFFLEKPLPEIVKEADSWACSMEAAFDGAMFGVPSAIRPYGDTYKQLKTLILHYSERHSGTLHAALVSDFEHNEKLITLHP